MAEPEQPSPFFAAWLDSLLRAARGAPLLDVACGRGRHALAAARRGASHVLGLDRERAALVALASAARAQSLRAQPVRCDLEGAHGLPLQAGRSGGVLVFRYLHRPLAPELAASLRPGGLLLYETFTIDQRDLGYGPKNPAFLLEPGELPTLFPTLEVVAFEELLTPGPRPEALARLAARRPG